MSTKKRYRIYWHRLNHVLNIEDVPPDWINYEAHFLIEYDWRNYETHFIIENHVKVVRETPFTTRIV